MGDVTFPITILIVYSLFVTIRFVIDVWFTESVSIADLKPKTPKMPPVKPYRKQNRCCCCCCKCKEKP